MWNRDQFTFLVFHRSTLEISCPVHFSVMIRWRAWRLVVNPECDFICMFYANEPSLFWGNCMSAFDDWFEAFVWENWCSIELLIIMAVSYKMILHPWFHLLKHLKKWNIDHALNQEMTLGELLRVLRQKLAMIIGRQHCLLKAKHGAKRSVHISCFP